MQPTGGAALARLAGRSSVVAGSCLWYVQDAWQVPHLYPSASAQWAGTRQHTDMGNIPHGAPVFWLGGGKGYGHIAPWDRTKNGVTSTDQLVHGRVATVPIAHIAAVWGLRLVGWGSTLGGVALPLGVPVVPVPHAAPAPAGPGRPHVSLEHLRASIIRDGPAPQGFASNKGNSLPVEAALWKVGLRGFSVDGSAGTGTFGPGSAYQRWQVRCGFRGAGADGYPPTVLTHSDSLTRLAALAGTFLPVA